MQGINTNHFALKEDTAYFDKPIIPDAFPTTHMRTERIFVEF